MRYSGLVRVACFFVLVVLALIPGRSIAGTLLDSLIQKEVREYRQDKWCEEHGGRARVVLADRTKIDCLTATQAIKFEVSSHWPEALGQALHYGFAAGKRPGVALILENKEASRYWLELNDTIDHFNLPVDVWMIEE